MDKILIIGTGGLAREFTSWFQDCFEIVGYSSKDHNDHSQFNLPGTAHNEDVTPELIGTNLAVLCIGNPVIKKQVFDKFSRAGFSFPSIIHHSSVNSDSASIQDGVVVAPNCVVSSNVKIGKLAYINFSCGIGHDAEVGDFVQINPGSQVGGKCKIGDQVLIGSNSTVLQGMSIGNLAVVASGAVIFSNVLDEVTVIGNPAKRIPDFDKKLDQS